ncbi:uracil-DNA glycosylase [Mycetocola miduiensis]|uniref:Uracil-DNA glycosylase n=1 Tax=Mycetocola miduiensis TaxID=995034 RepID=A0A1I5BT00_9MICO|nr:uracil-DNA glycosylase [Mycetocola miduiensis]SFN77830.1 Uracil-DNA glycosylase [Mycetocola miduiensis]
MTTGFDLAALAASGRLDAGWADALAPVQEQLDAIAQVLDADRDAGIAVLPAQENILRAFTAPLADVRVLIVGQDPYPTPGHSIGMAFAVEPHVRPLPRSLANIFRELDDDLSTPPPASGDLTPWTRNGVLLLNRVLTVRAGESGSHRGIGWETVTDLAIRTLVDRATPLVAILWGRDAQALAPILGDTPIVASAHPSPLSASRGFFGSRPFSRANALLEEQGADPVDWSLASAGLW